MKTAIDIHNYSADIDLSDIGDMIKKYCNEVERLEEENEYYKAENERLKQQIQALESGYKV